jgi:hypothetical protein
MSCELAGVPAAGGAKKVYAAKAKLRCPADANAIEIETVSADAKVLESPQRLTKVTMNWNYVFRRKPSKGTVTFDVYGGEALLKSCPAKILDEDFIDASSSSDSAECDLPADNYAKIDRVVMRIKGSYR